MSRCIHWSDQHNWVVTIHGCNVQSQQVYLGGLNFELKEYVERFTIEASFLSQMMVINMVVSILGIFVIWVSESWSTN